MSTSEALIALFTILGVITIIAFILQKICNSDPALRTGRKMIAAFCLFFIGGCIFLKISPSLDSKFNPKSLSSEQLIEEKISKSTFIDLLISRGPIDASKLEIILAFFCVIILFIILLIKVFKDK